MHMVPSDQSIPELISTEDGLHIKDTILWLDAQRCSGLSFMSSALAWNGGKIDNRIIATKETTELLAFRGQKPQALICPYNHIITIGRLKFELIPSGGILGGAQLWVQTEKQSILYSSRIQPDRINIVHQLQSKSANTLVLNALLPYENQALGGRRKEKERLLGEIKRTLANGRSPICLADPYSTAQELSKLISEAGYRVVVHPSIAKINRIYERHGSFVGNYGIYHDRKQSLKGKVAIFPHQTRGGRFKPRRPLPGGPIFAITDTPNFHSHTGIFRGIDERFIIPSFCDGRDLHDLLHTVNPRTLLISGPYAKEYAIKMQNSAPIVQAISPKHLPSLF